MPNYLFGKRVKWLFNYDGFPYYKDDYQHRCNLTDKNGKVLDEFPYWYVPKSLVFAWDLPKILDNDYYS